MQVTQAGLVRLAELGHTYGDIEDDHACSQDDHQDLDTDLFGRRRLFNGAQFTTQRAQSNFPLTCAFRSRAVQVLHAMVRPKTFKNICFSMVFA